MIKKLLSGFALALACMGSSQADVVLSAADTPLIFNMESLASSNFSVLIASASGYASTSNDIDYRVSLYSGLNGSGTFLDGGSYIDWGRNFGDAFDVAALMDGFSIVYEILTGSVTLVPGATDLQMYFRTERPAGKDSVATTEEGFLTPVRRTLTNNVPEPGTLLLLAIGAVAFAAVRQRPA